MYLLTKQETKESVRFETFFDAIDFLDRCYLDNSKGYTLEDDKNIPNAWWIIVNGKFTYYLAKQ